jgi:hypothetical protein
LVLTGVLGTPRTVAATGGENSCHDLTFISYLPITELTDQPENKNLATLDKCPWLDMMQPAPGRLFPVSQHGFPSMALGQRRKFGADRPMLGKSRKVQLFLTDPRLLNRSLMRKGRSTRQGFFIEAIAIESPLERIASRFHPL